MSFHFPKWKKERQNEKKGRERERVKEKKKERERKKERFSLNIIVRIEFSPLVQNNDNTGHYGPMETT